ncbi:MULTISPECIES: diaminopimelate epimerase [Hyphobacterium]|uniref:Diaminopimelate epimerase n=1 Tax=Hyphobacterium vulgare TaxID=1736751 RepID=A0ABV6ZXS9_9PROT
MKGLLMNGAGNAFLLADIRGGGAQAFTPERARALAAAHHLDQILLIAGNADAPVMRVVNADGGEVGACGNGARCVGWYLMQAGGMDTVTMGSLGGDLVAETAGAMRVRVDLGPARTGWREIPLAREMDTVTLELAVEAPGLSLAGPGAVSMGNPHCVFFVTDVDAVPAETIGPVLEHDTLFPERANIGFAQVIAPDRIRVRVWERGAGLTRACGTGAAAAVVAGHRKGLTGQAVTVVADGGELQVEWRADGHVTLEGPVAVDGEIAIPV